MNTKAFYCEWCGVTRPDANKGQAYWLCEECVKYIKRALGNSPSIVDMKRFILSMPRGIPPPFKRALNLYSHLKENLI